MTSEELKKLRELARGYSGRFFYDHERSDVGYIAKKCDEKRCDCEQKLNPDGDQDCSELVCEFMDEHSGPPLVEMLNAVTPLLDEIERLRKSDDEMGLAAIQAHAEYKERRNAQFAAYEFAHRATIAYLLDRAEQYGNSSGYRALFDELIQGIAEWQHVKCAEAGEYGDLEKRVGRIVGPRREGRTETEKLQEQVAKLREQLAAATRDRDSYANSGFEAQISALHRDLAAMTAARDEACDIAESAVVELKWPGTARLGELRQVGKEGGS